MHKKTFIVIILLIAVFTIVSLIITNSIKQEKSFIKLNLWANDIVEHFEEEIFLRDISNITYYNNYFFISSASDSRLYIMNNELKYYGSVGLRGSGPGESMYISTFCFYDNALFIFDQGNNKFIKYKYNLEMNEFERLTDIKLKKPDFIMDRICCDLTGKIFFETPTHNYPISVSDTSFSNIISFGNRDKYESLAEERARSFSHLFIDSQNNLVRVLKSEPVIEIYSNFNLIRKIDLSYNDIVQSRITFTNKEYKKNASNKGKTYSIFIDAYLDESRLFLLTIDNLSTKTRSNKVLIIDLKSEEENISGFVELNETGLEDWFSKICANGNILMAFNESTGHLCKFNLGFN